MHDKRERELIDLTPFQQIPASFPQFHPQSFIILRSNEGKFSPTDASTQEQKFPFGVAQNLSLATRERYICREGRWATRPLLRDAQRCLVPLGTVGWVGGGGRIRSETTSFSSRFISREAKATMTTKTTNVTKASAYK